MGMSLAYYLLFFAVCVGHAALWGCPLNMAYSQPIPKDILKAIRLIIGLVILLGPLLLLALVSVHPATAISAVLEGEFGSFLRAYVWVCIAMGAGIFPVCTTMLFFRSTPSAVREESTRTLDLWPELGSALLGDGHLRGLTRLPLNCVYKIDFTDLTLQLPKLPAAWDGLTILHLSDMHFIGTPSKAYFRRAIDEILASGPIDIIALTGDYVDSLVHHRWIIPLLGRLRWRETGLAVLGNHDIHYRPERIRRRLARLGYCVLGNNYQEITVRGEKMLVVGHEGPWYGPGPDLSKLPIEGFRLLLSHTPDNFYWAQKNGIDLMLSGHVHGGQIRVPCVGSIFVPSWYGRRFDMGTFAGGGTVMHVNRGLSGKEPLRFRCHPHVSRIVLTRA